MEQSISYGNRVVLPSTLPSSQERRTRKRPTQGMEVENKSSGPEEEQEHRALRRRDRRPQKYVYKITV
jgi:hypothetical protein